MKILALLWATGCLTYAGTYAYRQAMPQRFKIDVTASGKSGAARFYDSTVHEGSTVIVVHASAGQSSEAVHFTARKPWYRRVFAKKHGDVFWDVKQTHIGIGYPAPTKPLELK